jgi:hypothetical protein
MEHNVGGADRAVRIVAGLVVIGAGVYFHSWWGALGLVLVLTGLMRWCPGYLPFGISTGGRKPEGKSS